MCVNFKSRHFSNYTIFRLENLCTSGSNSTGSWIKFSDGTLLQRMKSKVTTINGDKTTTINLPISFITDDYDVAYCNIELNNTYHSFRGIYFQATTRNISNMVITTRAEGIFYCCLSFIIIGKWK
ncbi:hypothetical protein AAA294_02020 [Fusobacterium varium]|uniref:hypothetical protein n=1 Tax=Fusobacterium varium TaxID=856 RepID=UPI0032C0E00E